MAPQLSILVLGAGELGTAVLQGLTSKGRTDVEVTVLLRPETANLPRHAPKVAPIYALPGDVKILPCDLSASSRSELCEVMRPFDVVIGCTGYANNEAGNTESLQLKIAHAVLETGSVKLYVPWQFGVDYDQFDRGVAGGLFDDQKDVRELLRSAVEKGDTRTNWLIVSTGIFMSYLFQPWWGVVQKDEDNDGWAINALGDWENAVTVTTAEDIGNLTAEIVFAAIRDDAEGKALRNRPVFVAGDTICYDELVLVVGAATGKPSRKGELLEVPALIRSMEEGPEDVLNKYRVAFARDKGVAWQPSLTFNAQRGIKVTNAEQWAKVYLK